MCHRKQPIYPGRRRERGSGLIAAIALLVIVALLALAITRTVTLGAGSVGIDILSQRALLSASSGAQLGLNRVFAPVGTGACSGQVWDLSGLNGLPSCQATVTCNSVVVRGRRFYEVRSTGACSAGPDQAERVVLVRATP